MPEHGWIRWVFCVTVVVLMLAILVGNADAQGSTPQEVEPMAYLPVVSRSWQPPRWELRASQGVVQMEAPLVVEGYINGSTLRGWRAKIIWGASFAFLDAYYEIFPLGSQVDTGFHDQWVKMRQTWWLPRTATDEKVATIVIVPRYDGFLTVESQARPKYPFEWGRGMADSATIYSMRCFADWNGDGRRDIFDLMLILDKLGSSDPRYDINGDGVVDDIDYNVAKMYWNKPCPITATE